MTNIKVFYLFCIFNLLLFLSSKHSVGIVIDTPTIVAGTAKISGIIRSQNNASKNNIFVNITVSHPISGENVKYKTFVDSSGKFSIDVDVETDISLIALYTSLNQEKPLLVTLASGGVTNVDIDYNSNDNIENINVSPNINQNDITRGFEVMYKMVGYRSGRAPEPLYNRSTEYFLNYAKTILSERLEIVKNDTLISKGLKKVLSKDFRLFLYNAHVFDYESAMMDNYFNTNANDDKSKKPKIQNVDRSYYLFLKDFNLNDPQYLHCFTFLEFQKAILQNEILGLPMIGESDIPSWLGKVKVILSDLVGFDNGPYYDILAANAYGMQLSEEIRPLTEKQIENIVNYWRNGEIAKILFRKNKEVIELNKLKTPAVVNDISLVSDKVIEKIVSKYQNKVIFIDLWATWCSPCLEAMKQFRSTKGDFRDKDVVFVYLTNRTSPKKLWEEQIEGIGNEHYYLTDTQWEYIMKQFGLEGIPSYLLYNKKSMLVNKFTAFPGNEEVKEMINDALK